MCLIFVSIRDNSQLIVGDQLFLLFLGEGATLDDVLSEPTRMPTAITLTYRKIRLVALDRFIIFLLFAGALIWVRRVKVFLYDDLVCCTFEVQLIVVSYGILKKVIYHPNLVEDVYEV